MVDEIAKQVNISTESAYSVCATWILVELMDGHKHMWSDICSCHLDYYHERENFLQWIVTDDKTWVHNYQSETKHKMEASAISCHKEIQDTTIGRQVDVDHILGFSRAYS
jgi:hypothetical protein